MRLVDIWAQFISCTEYYRRHLEHLFLANKSFGYSNTIYPMILLASWSCWTLTLAITWFVSGKKSTNHISLPFFLLLSKVLVSDVFKVFSLVNALMSQLYFPYPEMTRIYQKFVPLFYSVNLLLRRSCLTRVYISRWLVFYYLITIYQQQTCWLSGFSVTLSLVA